MPPLPLRLALEPILPTRTPNPRNHFEYGFRLRLPDGPVLEHDDPLLAAFGASVERLCVGSETGEALQDNVFDPGRRVLLLPEPYDPDDPDAVGVWDAHGVRQAGTLPDSASAVVSAGANAGLEHRGLMLWEQRAASDGRRERAGLLVFAPTLVSVAAPPCTVVRPERAATPRLVLVADGSGDLRWWDPSGAVGPLAVTDLPFSPELGRELARLRADFEDLRSQEADDPRGFERTEVDWERDALETKAAELWRRARSELGRRYAVGFLGAGMTRPIWTPETDEDEDEPF